VWGARPGLLRAEAGASDGSAQGSEAARAAGLDIAGDQGRAPVRMPGLEAAGDGRAGAAENGCAGVDAAERSAGVGCGGAAEWNARVGCGGAAERSVSGGGGGAGKTSVLAVLASLVEVDVECVRDGGNEPSSQSADAGAGRTSASARARSAAVWSTSERKSRRARAACCILLASSLPASAREVSAGAACGGRGVEVGVLSKCGRAGRSAAGEGAGHTTTGFRCPTAVMQSWPSASRVSSGRGASACCGRSESRRDCSRRRASPAPCTDASGCVMYETTGATLLSAAAGLQKLVDMLADKVCVYGGRVSKRAHPIKVRCTPEKEIG
jgi:hypothetical protein